MSLKARLEQGVDTRSVGQVKFSPDDKYIYTLDKQNIVKLRVWDWANNKLIAETSTGEEVTTDMDASDGEFKVVVVGKHRLLFFKLNEVNGKFSFDMKSGVTAA